MLPNAIIRYAIGAALLFALSVAWVSSLCFAADLHAPGGGTIRALVIGIDKYPNLPPETQLAGAVADAVDISNTLAAAGVKVQMLIDGAAVRSRVIGEMNRLVEESKSGDLSIIAFSGHGMRVRTYRQWQGLDASGVQTQVALSRFGRSLDTGHEVVVDREMRAWLARFDAKGVDVLIIIDTCYGGAMRDVAAFAGGMNVRSLPGNVDDAVHDSFTGIPMTQREARANVREMSHVTFLAGATENSVVPEMSGIDRAHPNAIRGALSYFVARAIEGRASPDGKVTREQLFKFVGPNVRQATDDRQFIGYEPRIDSSDAQQKIVFLLGNAAPLDLPRRDLDVEPRPPGSQSDPVRVAIVNGPEASLSAIKKGHAPFVGSGRSEADVVWNVSEGTALSRGDLVMSSVDGSLLGNIIDRTWAIREIQKLSRSRIIDVTMREEGKSYKIGDRPELRISDVQDSYLTLVNIAADGTLQLLFPANPSQNPHIREENWIYDPVVRPPFGADLVVAIETSRPVEHLIDWLHTHNGKPDAFDLPVVVARTIAADATSRVGTVGLYTTP
jgi:Caspase domain/Domain of unknown function (DUF4384)